MPSAITLGEAGAVPYAVLTPDAAAPLPVCLFLLGFGGTRDSLGVLQPVFDGWWNEGLLPPMMVVVPTPGADYYLNWKSLLLDDLLPAVRASAPASDVTLLAGISGGGYGALKLAFAHPDRFAAVAAMQPMLEPGLRESDVGPRNRLHHSAGGPPQLIGPARDAVVWEQNNPANLARANAQAIGECGLAIYLEAADHDFLNAHDGAEFLHRTLWDLDLSHEYWLVRGADHGGLTMRPRMRAMFGWLGAILRPPAVDAAMEQAAAEWLASGMKGNPPAGATTTEAFVRFMRARFEPLRTEADAKRRYGQM
jgi:S-formylglutathione hydrolase